MICVIGLDRPTHVFRQDINYQSDVVKQEYPKLYKVVYIFAAIHKTYRVAKGQIP
jgi:hypothetical protein